MVGAKGITKVAVLPGRATVSKRLTGLSTVLVSFQGSGE